MFLIYVNYSLLVIIVIFYYANGVKIRKLKVPQAVRINHTVKLDCQYVLENEQLYTIKWYWENREFFRYVPKEEPPTRIFSFPDLVVDLSESNANEVKLLNVKRSLSGIYQCEVSADAPLFHTDIQSAPMTVVDLQNGLPTITINNDNFQMHNMLIATCQAPPSIPASNLTWFVNDQKVPDSTYFEIKNLSEYEIAISQLELSMPDKSSGPKLIRLRCDANIFKIYHISSPEVKIDLGEQILEEPEQILLTDNQVKTNAGVCHLQVLEIKIVLVCLLCSLHWKILEISLKS